MDLNKEEFLNWLKAVIGLSHLKDAIVEAVNEEMELYYDQTIRKQMNCSTFPYCSGNVPCKVCLKLLGTELFNNRRFRGKPIANDRLIICAKDHWEIAKCYTTNSDIVTSDSGFASTDCAGVLSIILNAKNVSRALGIDTSIGTIDGKTDPMAKVLIIFNVIHYKYINFPHAIE